MYRNIKIVAIFFFFGALDSLAQDSWNCTFHHLKEGQSINLKSLSPEKEKMLFKQLSDYGLNQSFYPLVTEGHPGITAISNISGNGKKSRYILIPNKVSDSLVKLNNDVSLFYQLMHAYGHHLNKHGVRDSIIRHENELQADKFAGYQLNRLGFINDTNKLESQIPELYRKNEIFGPGLRIKAFKNGWTLYNQELAYHDKEIQIALFSENNAKADSLYRFAREEKLVKPKEGAVAFSNAYRYSNGNNLKALYGAFELYFQLKNFNLALLHGNEIIKKGSGFLREREQQDFFLEMSKIYFKNNHCSKAFEYLHLAILIDDKNSDLLKYQTDLTRLCSNFNENIALLKKRILNEGATTELYYKLSEQYFENQNRMEALKYLKRILLKEPGHVFARLLLSKVYYNEWHEMVNILKNQKEYRNIVDFKHILKTKNELFKKAENVLIDGLKLNKKNKVLSQKLKSMRRAERNVSTYWPNRTYYTVQ